MCISLSPGRAKEEQREREEEEGEKWVEMGFKGRRLCCVVLCWG